MLASREEVMKIKQRVFDAADLVLGINEISRSSVSMAAFSGWQALPEASQIIRKVKFLGEGGLSDSKHLAIRERMRLISQFGDT